MNAAIVGFGLGFFVALQLGPMSLFLTRSTLRSGWRVGLSVGAGIASVDGLYASAGAGGATPLLTIHPVRLALGLVGAIVLVWLGARTLYKALRVRIGGDSVRGVNSETRFSHRTRWNGFQPVHHRVVGRDLRRREHRRVRPHVRIRGAPGRRSCGR